MSQLIEKQSEPKNKKFWDSATKYAASIDADESFVNEMAYMMVTLHRTGA